MLSFLKNHPFAVEAFFERSLVLTFAAAKEDLQPFIPECLALDIFNYSTTDIRQTQGEHQLEVRSTRSDFRVTIRTDAEDVALSRTFAFR